MEEASSASAAIQTTLKLPGIHGAEMKLPIASFREYLQRRCKVSDSFASLLRKCILNSRERSLTLLLYHDLAVPGNILHSNHPLKSHLVYCSFAEFRHNLSCESAWFTVAVIRNAELEKVVGGMSCVMRLLVKEIKAQVEAGIPFHANSEVLLLQIKKYGLIADESAVKHTYECKGASGIRPCIKCQNVLIRQHLCDAPFVHISEADPTKFIELTDEAAFRIVDTLAEMVRENVGISEFQTVSGWNYVETGLMQDKEARLLLSPSQAIYDPMHIYLSNGIFGLEVRLLFGFVDGLFNQNRLPVSSKDFIALACANWITPKHLHEHSLSGREAAASLAVKDRASASQLLWVYPLLDYFTRTVLASYEQLHDQVQSMIALCEVLRLVQASKRMQFFSGSLLTAQSKSLSLFVQSYGKDLVKPKHHFQFHVATQIADVQAYVDCFCMERKHRSFKNATKHVARHADFSSTMLSKLQLHELEEVREARFEDGLVRQHTLQLAGMSISNGSCLLLNTTVPTMVVVEKLEGQWPQVKLCGQRWSCASQLQSSVVFLCSLYKSNQSDQFYLQVSQETNLSSSIWSSPKACELELKYVKAFAL